ncbi:MAG: PspA/IM30 family protein [Acidimicrobiales bacterium]|nr:PspA/IM30 family protein [Acidimicrobiales bacterium]
MIKLLKRWWRYTTTRLTGKFEERADPKVQLEQAIQEAQDQHRRLKEQAASIIANQKQTEMRLSRTLEDYEKVSNNARQAVIMADEANRSGDTAKAAEYTSAAEAFANRMIGLEREVDDLKELHGQAGQAAEQARAAVEQNSAAMQQKLAERQRLMGQLDQAQMAEQMNTAMASLSETVSDETPSFDQIREKIEMRYAKAQGMGELSEGSLDSKMFEIEQAAMNNEARGRLDEIRGQLGLSAPEPAGANELQHKIEELKAATGEGEAAGSEPSSDDDT